MTVEIGEVEEDAAGIGPAAGRRDDGRAGVSAGPLQGKCAQARLGEGERAALLADALLEDDIRGRGGGTLEIQHRVSGHRHATGKRHVRLETNGAAQATSEPATT